MLFRSELVDDPGEALREALADKPNDGRHVTASRDWQGGRGRKSGNWTKEGSSRVPYEKRLAIYAEEGLDPEELMEEELAPGIMAAADLALPAPQTEEYDWLAERIELQPRPRPSHNGWGATR